MIAREMAAPSVCVLHMNESTSGMCRSTLFPCGRCEQSVECAGTFFRAWAFTLPRARALVSVSGVPASARTVTIVPYIVTSKPAGGMETVCMDKCAQRTASKATWNTCQATWELTFEPMLASHGAYHVAVMVDGVRVCVSAPMCVTVAPPRTLIAIHMPVMPTFIQAAAALRQRCLHYRAVVDARGRKWAAATFQTADAARIAYYTQKRRSNGDGEVMCWVPCTGFSEIDAPTQMPIVRRAADDSKQSMCLLPPPPALPIAFTSIINQARVHQALEKTKKRKANVLMSSPPPAGMHVTTGSTTQMDTARMRPAMRRPYNKRAPKTTSMSDSAAATPLQLRPVKLGRSVALPSPPQSMCKTTVCSADLKQPVVNAWSRPFAQLLLDDDTPDAFAQLFCDNEVVMDSALPRRPPCKIADTFVLLSARRPSGATTAHLRTKNAYGVYPLPPDADTLDIDCFFKSVGL